MARAKRTDRAEARRRHRADLAARAAALQSGEATAADAVTAGAQRGAAPANGAQPARPGIGYAFKAAFRPLDLRGDLAYLPQLIRHRSVIVPSLITILATAVYFAFPPQTTDGEAPGTADLGTFAAYIMFQYFVFSPPVGSAFLAGFLAPKASWLAGVVVGIVAAICFSIVLGSGIGADIETEAQQQAFLTQAFVLSPMGSAMFAAASAWYKRFLNLANPNRGRRQQQRRGGSQRQRPAASRSGSRR